MRAYKCAHFLQRKEKFLIVKRFRTDGIVLLRDLQKNHIYKYMYFWVESRENRRGLHPTDAMLFSEPHFSEKAVWMKWLWSHNLQQSKKVLMFICSSVNLFKWIWLQMAADIFDMWFNWQRSLDVLNLCDVDFFRVSFQHFIWDVCNT